MAGLCHCISLRRATRSVTRLYDETLAPAGLRVTQYSLLKRIQRLGEASIGALAAETELDRTTLTRNLKPLREAGLIEERDTEDRRCRLLRVTPAGRAAVKRAEPLWAQAQQHIDALLGERGSAALRELVATLEHAVADTPAAQ